MQNLKKILSEKICTSPDIMQFAKDRKYEKSWIIPLNKTKPTENEMWVVDFQKVDYWMKVML